MTAEAIAERGYSLDWKNPNTAALAIEKPSLVLGRYQQCQATVRQQAERLATELGPALAAAPQDTVKLFLQN